MSNTKSAAGFSEHGHKANECYYKRAYFTKWPARSSFCGVYSRFDITGYIELFAPKPWLIASTEKDFFTLAGAKVALKKHVDGIKFLALRTELSG